MKLAALFGTVAFAGKADPRGKILKKIFEKF